MKLKEIDKSLLKEIRNALVVLPLKHVNKENPDQFSPCVELNTKGKPEDLSIQIKSVFESLPFIETIHIKNSLVTFYKVTNLKQFVFTLEISISSSIHSYLNLLEVGAEFISRDDMEKYRESRNRSDEETPKVTALKRSCQFK